MVFVHQETKWGAQTGAAAHRNGDKRGKSATVEQSNHLAQADRSAMRRPAARASGDESPTSEIVVDLPEAHGAIVVAVTTDSELRATLTDLLPRNGIVFADSAEQVLGRPVPNHCAVLIVEQTLSRPAFEQVKAYLKASAPALVNIMIGNHDDGSSLVGLLAAGCIDRFMTKPLRLGPTRSALRSALQQHHSLRPSIEAECAKPDTRATKSGGAAPNAQVMRGSKPKIAAVPQLQIEHTGPHHAAESRKRNSERDQERVSVALLHPSRESTTRAAETPRRLPAPSWTFAVAAMLAVAGFVSWGMSRGPEVDVNKDMMNKIVASHLVTAQRAFELGSYVDPPELSAAHFYNAVLELDPKNAEATRGLAAVTDRLIADGKLLISAGDLLRAQSALDSVRRMQPSHPELAEVTASLLNARAAERLAIQAGHSTGKSNPEPIGAVVPQVAVAAGPAVSKSSANVVSKADNNPSGQQHLSQPEPRAGDKLDAPSANKSPEATRLASVADVSLASTNGTPQPHSTQTKRIDEAKPIESTPVEPALAALARVAAVPETITPERSIASIDSSGSTHPAISAAIDKPKLIKYVPPLYPAKARADGVEGWVDVKFVVNSDGNVMDAHVENGKLGYQFHRAALAAVTQWKFAPASNGAIPYRPMNVRLEFQLAK